MDLFGNILKNSFTIVLKNKILFENLNMKKRLKSRKNENWEKVKMSHDHVRRTTFLK